MITQNIIDLVKTHEGLRLHPYPDTNGVATIGYGHAIKAAEHFSSITQAQADSLLLSDLQQAERDARALVASFDTLCAARQAVLIDLSFNMGKSKLSEFHHMLNAILQNNFVNAAYQMRNSDWYNQVKTRAVQDYNMMLTGEFQ